MANALPDAIGAQAAYPGRQVISMSGDGGFSMLMGDILTLETKQIAGESDHFQERITGVRRTGAKRRPASSSLQPTSKVPDFAKIAEGAGLLGLTARTPDQVEPMIAQALKHNGPVVVEVFVARQELAMPPTITLEQAKGFSLFMLKAVLNGRGDEIIDLARVNLVR